jgi:hypothetical protein
VLFCDPIGCSEGVVVGVVEGLVGMVTGAIVPFDPCTGGAGDTGTVVGLGPADLTPVVVGALFGSAEAGVEVVVVFPDVPEFNGSEATFDWGWAFVAATAETISPQDTATARLDPKTMRTLL